MKNLEEQCAHAVYTWEMKLEQTVLKTKRHAGINTPSLREGIKASRCEQIEHNVDR